MSCLSRLRFPSTRSRRLARWVGEGAHLPQLQKVLERLTGQSTIPNVWSQINRSSISFKKILKNIVHTDYFERCCWILQSKGRAELQSWWWMAVTCRGGPSAACWYSGGLCCIQHDG